MESKTKDYIVALKNILFWLGIFIFGLCSNLCHMLYVCIFNIHNLNVITNSCLNYWNHDYVQIRLLLLCNFLSVCSLLESLSVSSASSQKVFYPVHFVFISYDLILLKKIFSIIFVCTCINFVVVPGACLDFYNYDVYGRKYTFKSTTG